MLPSRGVAHASQALGLRRILPSTRPLQRLGTTSRCFGTSLQSSQVPTIISPSLSTSSSRIRNRQLGGAALPLAFGRQTRLNSTQSPPTLPTTLPAADLPASINPNTASLLEAPEHIGYLHSLGLDFWYGPTASLQWLLEHIHVYSGLPWWGSIATMCFLLRAAIFFPSLRASENGHSLGQLRKNPAFVQVMTEFRSNMTRQDPQSRAAVLRARGEMKAMQKEAGINMWWSVVPFINIPIGFGMFRLLRSMSTLPVPGLETGGLLWIPDLTVPDPFFLLPAVSSGIMLYIMKANLPFMTKQQGHIMKLISYVLAPLSFLVTLNLAAAVQWMFFCSASLQLVQSTIVFQPWLRRWANLPPMKLGGEEKAEFADLVNAWKGARTVNTTARVESQSPLQKVKESFNSAKQQGSEYMGGKDKQRKWKEAQEYERKRQLEEEQREYDRHMGGGRRRR